MTLATRLSFQSLGKVTNWSEPTNQRSRKEQTTYPFDLLVSQSTKKNKKILTPVCLDRCRSVLEGGFCQ